MPRTALITDGSSIAGIALLDFLEHRCSRDEWARIVVVSQPGAPRTNNNNNNNNSGTCSDDAGRVHFVQLDFSERPRALIEHMTESCTDVTHAYFCSYAHEDNPVILNRANTALFENFLLALTCVAPGLANCTLIHTDSSRYYGSHLCPVPTPCREDDPRRGDPEDNFQHAQEDFLATLQTNQAWTWNVVRPESIMVDTSSPSPSTTTSSSTTITTLGNSTVITNPLCTNHNNHNNLTHHHHNNNNNNNNSNNIALTLAMYFLITRELAEEARMPSNQRYWNGSSSSALSDSALLAQFTLWISMTDECANEAFNFANGDHFTWQFMWPRLAAYFGAYATPDQHFRLTEPEIIGGGGGSKKVFPLQQEFRLVDWAQQDDDKKSVWERMCDEAGVPEAKASFEAGCWSTLDALFQRTWSTTLSMNKARKFGWTGFADSFESFVHAFERLSENSEIL